VHSDVPGRFHEGMRLLALSDDGTRRELEIEELWPHKSYLVLKFVGVDTISDAEKLLGAELQVSKENRAQLEAGWNYVSDLVGCTLFDGEREIGIVKDVRFGAGEAPLLVVVVGRQEHEIPFAEDFLKTMDIAGKRIVMNLPEGLLEVNAPLTAEEKEQQRGNRG
jgi:16S rRNA processing protein RimM